MIRIVLVDDEEHILRGIKKLVQRSGTQYQVIGAFDSSLRALLFLKENRADVLITDIRMPELDGLALTEQAQKLQKNLHCIILSGYSDFGYAKNAIRLGVAEYLLKPVDDAELKQTLERVIEHDEDRQMQSRYYIKSDVSREIAYIKKEIETNCASFHLDICAEQLGKSRDYLAKLFRKEVGISIKDYLKEIRILRAKELLQGVHSYKIYEISELVGFTDTVYFSKQFKEVTGMTPKEYQMYCLPLKKTED